MSVQTQIDRISGNVSAALTAIADKGVTVPDGSNSDALAGLIQAIHAGGGGLELWGRTQIMTGSFTLSDTMTTNYEIADVSSLLGNYTYNVTAFLWKDISTREEKTGIIFGVINAIFYGASSTNTTSVNGGVAINTHGVVSAFKSGILSVSTASKMLTVYFNANYCGYAGDTYNWLALAVKEV